MVRSRPGLPSWTALALALALAACGDDGGAPAQGGVPAGGRAPGAPGTAAAGTPKGQLAVKPHIEDRVACPRPDQPSDPKGGKCDLKAPSCGEHLYCLQLAQGSFCEPCPERDGIRHAFRDRDFDPEHNRDPFQPPTGGPTDRTGSTGGVTPTCPRSDQLVASSYSYADLKLVGIVAQGTQRKVLMTMGKDGFIIKRGDCVGKEKAMVKDIGQGYVTFQGEADEYSVQLNPKQLLVNDPMPLVPSRRTTITPVAPPLPGPTPRASGAGMPAAPAAPPAAPPAGMAPGTSPPPRRAGAAAPAAAPPAAEAPPAPNKP
jgi:hypothetical protein